MINELQEIVFSSSDNAINKQISRLEKAGRLKKIAGRVYTSNLNEDPVVIVRRNLFSILGQLYPGAVLSHRSALEFAPTEAGQIFITYSYTKRVQLPGVIVRLIKGKSALPHDHLLSGGLHAAQLERALLENLEVSRKAGPESKNVPISTFEQKLESIIRVKGEAGLNEVRDKAKELAVKLDKWAEFDKLNKLIGAILATKPSNILTSSVAMARAFGLPYDAGRLALFEWLFSSLMKQEFPDRPSRNVSDIAFRNFAFFEAYFSNYIEGTEFELEDARRIIDTGIPMSTRHDDSHDVLGTFQLVSHEADMMVTPQNHQELLDILLSRHKILMQARIAKNPGAFKDKNNRAGETVFVDHTLVRGTLIKGFEYYRACRSPFAKAAFIMFMVSEVHPFLDGNGRVARIMMNAELVKERQTRIIIPTVYRDDYVGALRRLTRQQDADVYIRMLQRAHAFSHTLFCDNFETAKKHLELSNAFKHHDEGYLKVIDDLIPD